MDKYWTSTIDASRGCAGSREMGRSLKSWSSTGIYKDRVLLHVWRINARVYRRYFGYARFFFGLLESPDNSTTARGFTKGG